MTLQNDWHGRTLQAALSEQPSLSLDFYSYGVMLRKREGDAVTEYAVDPAQVAVALAAKITFDTGLISGDTLLVRREGVKKTVVEYRKAQLTGVFLDGSETDLRVPLPPLLMIRFTNENRSPSYGVKRRLLHRLPIHSFVTYAGIGDFISSRSLPVCRPELEVFLGGA